MATLFSFIKSEKTLKCLGMYVAISLTQNIHKNRFRIVDPD